MSDLAIKMKMKHFSREKIFTKEIIKFGYVGIITSIYGISCYYVLLELLKLPLYPVYIAVYFTGIGLSYLLNAHFTFKKKYNYQDSIKYFFIYVLGLIIALLLLKLTSIILPRLSDFKLALLVIIPRVFITFLLVKLLIYRK